MRALPLCVWFNPSAGFRQIILSLALFSLVASGANAASYQMIDGTVVDPILTTGGAVHSYSGANIMGHMEQSGVDLSGAYLVNARLDSTVLPNANLSNANLTNAYLLEATLRNANLSNANLTNAYLRMAYLIGVDLGGANLSGANLKDAELIGADLGDANLSGANLNYASWLGTTTGSPYYNAETNFTNAYSGGWGSALFDPVAAGWTLVPEPSTALLLGIGLAGLGMRRRRAH